MKTNNDIFKIKIIYVVVFYFFIGFSQIANGTIKSNQSQPNIIIFIADDLGWGHVGWQNSIVKTPYLDNLANNGVKLNRHYVAPCCSPTRVSLLTGRYWSRFDVNRPLGSYESKGAIPHNTLTLASGLKKMGYQTALIGKWHLGASIEHGPENYGFDYFYGLRIGGMTPYTHKWLGVGESVLWRNDSIIEEEGHITDLLTKEAICWIGKSDNKPFFLYLAYTSPHVPLKEPQRWMNLYQENGIDLSHQLYWAAISHLDDSIGRVISELDRKKQRENTLIIFISDNGAPGQPNLMQVKADQNSYINVTLPGDNFPFRGKKGDLYEGGIRTPAFVHWQKFLLPDSCNQIVHITDWMPTILSLTEHKTDSDINWDGHNIWDCLTREKENNIPRTIFSTGWNYGANEKEWALHHGDWKLIQRKQPNRSELYYFSTDISENIDLYSEKPKIVKRLSMLLNAELNKEIK
jgi:arylsulfatase A-like enzyme